MIAVWPSEAIPKRTAKESRAMAGACSALPKVNFDTKGLAQAKAMAPAAPRRSENLLIVHTD
jgi:hypothetical protein